MLLVEDEKRMNEALTELLRQGGLGLSGRSLSGYLQPLRLTQKALRSADDGSTAEG